MAANRVTDLDKFALEEIWRPYQSMMGYEKRLEALPRSLEETARLLVSDVSGWSGRVLGRARAIGFVFPSYIDHPLVDVVTGCVKKPTQVTAEPVAVKALEWADDHETYLSLYSDAETILGTYQVAAIPGYRNSDEKEWSLSPSRRGSDGKRYSSADEAKAAAQADYERRVLSALATKAAAEPVLTEATVRAAYAHFMHKAEFPCSASAMREAISLAISGLATTGRDRLILELRAQLADSYDCTRVWDAWSVGTMSEDDFVPVDDRVEEIADALLVACG